MASWVSKLNICYIFQGQTGRVAFDEMGDRMFAEYKIINMKPSNKNDGKRVKEATVGHYEYKTVSQILIRNYA